MIPAYSQIGADPEFLLLNSNDKPVNASALLPYEKQSNEAKRYASDGVSLELHPRPDSCRANWLELIMKPGMQQLHRWLEKNNLTLKATSAKLFTKAELQKGDDRARQWLCNPSQNAYGLESTLPDDKYRYRFFGGHLSISTSNELNDNQVRNIVVWADIMITLVQIMLDPKDKKQSIRRRTYYGLPGEYRTRSIPVDPWMINNYGSEEAARKYGYCKGQIIEVRSPSNMTFVDPILTHMFMGILRHALGMADVKVPVLAPRIIDAIREYNAKAARQIFMECLPTILKFNAPRCSVMVPEFICNLMALLDHPELLDLPRYLEKREINMAAWNWYTVEGAEHWFSRERLKRSRGQGDHESFRQSRKNPYTTPAIDMSHIPALASTASWSSYGTGRKNKDAEEAVKIFAPGEGVLVDA